MIMEETKMKNTIYPRPHDQQTVYLKNERLRICTAFPTQI